MFEMDLISRILATLLLISLAGCATLEDEIPDNWSAKRLYDEGRKALQHEDYRTTIEYLEKLETRFPFGAQTQQGQLMTAYAYYKNSDPESAIATADRFIKLNPTHPDVDYAYYIRGLAHFYSRDNFLDNLFQLDTSVRNPDSVRRSFQYFSELVQRFPNSQYAKDAVQRMVYLRETLARYELHVADYYMRREAWLAAANRAKGVLERYPRTPAVSDALALLSEAYYRMGIHDLAADSLLVLEKNQPKHKAIARLHAMGIKPSATKEN